MDFPAARASASAAFVRSLIIRRSHCASVAIMFATISPVAVLVSMPTSSATSCHPSERLRSRRSAVSRTLRLTRSSFATTRASALPAARRVRASLKPGRPFVVLPTARLGEKSHSGKAPYVGHKLPTRGRKCQSSCRCDHSRVFGVQALCVVGTFPDTAATREYSSCAGWERSGRSSSSSR